MQNIFSLIEKERKRQNNKWGIQDHPNFVGGDGEEMNIPLSKEEIEELCECVYGTPTPENAKECCEENFQSNSGSWMDILLEEVCELFEAKDLKHLQEELIQVASVATQWHEAISRQTEKENENGC